MPQLDDGAAGVQNPLRVADYLTLQIDYHTLILREQTVAVNYQAAYTEEPTPSDLRAIGVFLLLFISAELRFDFV